MHSTHAFILLSLCRFLLSSFIFVFYLHGLGSLIPGMFLGGGGGILINTVASNYLSKNIAYPIPPLNFNCSGPIIVVIMFVTLYALHEQGLCDQCCSHMCVCVCVCMTPPPPPPPPKRV